MVVHHETPVLVVGGGPAGLIAALQLARNGVKCMLVERNLDTTRWPKMDITNCRSMELLKRLGVDQGLRKVGVPQNYSFDVLFSTGLSDGGEKLAQWDLPSPDWWRKHIKEQNDGSMPREPYQRCSQAIFEAWLKPHIQAEPLVDSYFGIKFESLTESETGVECELVDQQSGEKHVVKAQYVVGCDGAGSRVRKSIGIELTGGPVPGIAYLIHFKSRELGKIQRQGQFWHIFFTSGDVIISQDEVDTWTIHHMMPLGSDTSSLDPKKTIQQALGGSLEPYPIEIDEILVTSDYRPNIYLADRYASDGGRVFLSGDAAHQNIPTGGYGMNTAVGDSFDIGWKLAAVLGGYGGPSLLSSYEHERRPVAARNIERSGVHWSVHAQNWETVGKSPGVVTSATDDGETMRKTIARHWIDHDGENKDHGIELGYRCNGSPVVVADSSTKEPDWTPKHYIPSTWPGARAPQVFLKDGRTSIFDLFGQAREYTLVDFSPDGKPSKEFAEHARTAGLPLKVVHLPDEPHVRAVWEDHDAVLVRPDDHVAWRSSADSQSWDVPQILAVVTGRVSPDTTTHKNGLVAETGFTGTVGNVEHASVQQMGAFQK